MKRKKITAWISCVCMILMMCGIGRHAVSAVTPRVMVWDYSIEEGDIYAGKEFTLHIILKNTASAAVRNLKLTLSTENGEFLPVDGAGTAYVDKINGDAEIDLSFSMTALAELEEKSYKLIVKTEYESGNGTEYTVEDSLFLPVHLEQRLSVTDIFIPEEYLELGDTVEVSASVNNLGSGTLRNVTAEVSGDNLAEAGNYVGNIESGKSGMVDILTKATGISVVGDKNTLTITYEDREGKIQEQEFLISATIEEPVYTDLEKVKEPADVGDILGRVAWIVLGMLFLLAVIWYLIRRRKRKQKMLEEF